VPSRYRQSIPDLVKGGPKTTLSGFTGTLSSRVEVAIPFERLVWHSRRWASEGKTLIC
jgi:hypothetical protein